MRKFQVLSLLIVLGLLFQIGFEISVVEAKTTEVDSFDVNTVGIGLWSNIKSSVNDYSGWEKGFYTINVSATGNWAYKYIYRDIDSSGKIKVSARFLLLDVSSSNYRLIFALTQYSYQWELEPWVDKGFFGVEMKYDALKFIYKGFLGSAEYVVLENIDFGEFYRVYFDIDKEKSKAKIKIEFDNGTKIFEKTVTDAQIFVKENLKVYFGGCVRYSGDYIVGKLDYVEAPFEEIGWVGENVESYEDAPYYIYNNDSNAEGFITYITDFVGIKMLMYFDYTGLDSGSELVKQIVYFYFYNEDGTLKGYVAFRREIGNILSARYFLTVYDSGGSAIFQKVYFPSDIKHVISFCIWFDGRNWFAGISYGHNENPLDVCDISDYASFIVKISHYAHRVFSDGDLSVTSWFDEVEIFTDEDHEGISRPRFGGMWWNFKPIQVLRRTITQALTTIGEGLTNTFKPLIESIKTDIASLASDIWADFSSGWNSIFSNIESAITTLAADVWSNFNDAWTSTFNAIESWGTGILADIKNAILQVNVFSALENVAGDVVGWLGSALIDYVFTIPFSWKDAVQTMIQTFLDGGEWFFGLFGLRDVFIGFENLMLSATPWISFVISIVLTFAPIVMGFHFVFAILQTVNEGDFTPLADAVVFYVNIGMFFIKIIEIVVRTIWNFIKTIAEAIPL